MKCFPKKYLLTLFLITFYLFSVKGALGMPLLPHLLDDDHGISVTAAHGDIHLNRHHREHHKPHDHHDNDFSDIHPGLIDTEHEHSEHESHLNDYSEDAIATTKTVVSLKVFPPAIILNTIPVMTTYRYGAASLKAPPPLHLALAHISTTVLLI